MSISRRTFIKATSTSAAALVAAPAVHAASRVLTSKLILGQGEYKFQLIHDWLTPPDGLAWGDTHGLCQDADGRIYVAHTVHGSSESPHAVAVFDHAGKFITSWGKQFRGGAHGLDIRKENGQEFLYHCDSRRRVIVKTDLKGETVWQTGWPSESGHYESQDRFCPTNVAFAPNGDFFVGDGYGSSYIHRYTADGTYIKTIAKPGSDKGQVSCPHGLWIDDRSGQPLLVVADRSNRRIQYMTLDGEHLSFVTDGVRLPCHFKIRGELMLVPDLESVVTLFDADNKPVAHIGDGHPSKLRGAPRDRFIQDKFIHPHDAIFLPNGDILVAEWVPIGRITLLKRV